MIERQPSKLKVASLNLVFRSKIVLFILIDSDEHNSPIFVGGNLLNGNESIKLWESGEVGESWQTVTPLPYGFGGSSPPPLTKKLSKAKISVFVFADNMESSLTVGIDGWQS